MIRDVITLKQVENSIRVPTSTQDEFVLALRRRYGEHTGNKLAKAITKNLYGSRLSTLTNFRLCDESDSTARSAFQRTAQTDKHEVTFEGEVYIDIAGSQHLFLFGFNAKMS